MKTHWYSRINRKEALFLFVLVLLLLTLFNILNFSNKRWTLHPDDHDVYVFSKVLLKTGHLWYKTPYNDQFRTTAFQPALERFESDGPDRYAVRGAYSPGIYILTAPGHIAGLRGPFFIVSIMGIMGIIFLYFFTREVFGTATAMLASVFLGLSAAYAYWSNMLFSNIPALAFFAGGLCFLAKSVSKPDRRAYYSLAVALFSLSVWMRYDYVLLVVLVGLVTLLAYRRKLKAKPALQSLAVLAVLVFIIAAANLLTSGSLTGMRGTYGAGQQSGGDLLRYVPKLFNGGVLLNNARMYIYWVAPVMVVLGILGMVLVLKQERSGFAFMLVFIPILVLFIYGKGDGFWGYYRNWLASSYTRYFLPLFMCLAVLAAVFTVRLAERIPWRAVATFVAVAVISVHVATSAYVLYRNEFGLEFTDRYSGNRKSVDAFFAKTPGNAVVVDLSSDDYFRFDIVSRAVLNPSYFEGKRAEAKLAGLLEDLDGEGTPVFVINNPERSMLDIDGFTHRYENIMLKAIEHPAVFKYGSRTPDIYMLEVAR